VLNLKVLSPEKTVLNTQCKSVTLPTSEGQITVYAHHAPIYTIITYGELIAHLDTGDTSLAIGAGFAEINGEGVTVLTNYGVGTDEIDAARAEEARSRAEELIKNRKEDTDMALAQAELLRSMVELKLASKKRSTN
jgi:F-type H+-transporting ATPase subunit epsilon